MKPATFFILMIITVGVFLLGYGLSNTQTFSEKVVEGVSGHYTDNTSWIIGGGIGLLAIGGVLAFMGSLSNRK